MNRKLLVAALSVAVLAIASSWSVSGAGSNAAEEAAIRKIIASGKLQSLPDSIFWSGAYKRPAVGPEKAELRSGQERVPGSQKQTTEPIRIVVADSRDLAYEYGKGSLDFDAVGGQHVHLETGILRVWQKEGSDWKVAATFVHPYDE